jgi:hypothetical protein
MGGFVGDGVPTVMGDGSNGSVPESESVGGLVGGGVLGGASVPLGTGAGSNGSVPEPPSVGSEVVGPAGVVAVSLGAWPVESVLPPVPVSESAVGGAPNGPDCGDVVTIGIGNSPANRPELAPPDAVDPRPGAGGGSCVVTPSGSAGGACAMADGRASRSVPRDV